jgi:hypothetical protein
MLEAIAQASSSVTLETYFFWSGEIASRFRDPLSERAAREWRSGSNDEINLTVCVREVGGRLEEMFIGDIARSHQYTYAQWRSRPLRQRITSAAGSPSTRPAI